MNADGGASCLLSWEHARSLDDIWLIQVGPPVPQNPVLEEQGLYAVPTYRGTVAHYIHRSMVKTVAGGPSKTWAEVGGREELRPNEMFDPSGWTTWSCTNVALDKLGLPPTFISTTAQQRKKPKNNLDALILGRVMQPDTLTVYDVMAQHPSYYAQLDLSWFDDQQLLDQKSADSSFDEPKVDVAPPTKDSVLEEVE